jgi:Ca2+-binding EF-hand superfamily protein
LISREHLYQLIAEHKVPELTPVELNVILKQADRGSKGYISVDRFIERLQEYVTETKGEAGLRNFALACKR